MQHWSALLGITAAIGIGAASPGPSFVMVARTAASQGRPHGLLAAAGIGTGGLIFAILALLGLHSLLNLAPALYLALKLAGGLYLAWLGWRIWPVFRRKRKIATRFGVWCARIVTSNVLCRSVVTHNTRMLRTRPRQKAGSASNTQSINPCSS